MMNTNAPNSPPQDGDVPTWLTSPENEETTRTPWWPAVVATLVGGAVSFLVWSPERMGILEVIGYGAAAAFLGSWFFRSSTARLVRRIAVGLVLGGALGIMAFFAYIAVAMSVGGV